MADIYEKIYKNYSIDISQENILKLYKIENYDITESVLQECIDSTRKRWNQSINGANEKNAARDRLRLEKADLYEQILRDDKLRKELYQYYNSSNSSHKNNENSNSSDLLFAKEYFELLSTSKKIRKKDVEFFFEYYQEERKKKKAILEMLSKEFKVIGLGKDESYSETDDVNEKKKEHKFSLVVNLFQEETILKIKKCIRFYTDAKNSSELCLQFSNLNTSLYDFLELDNTKDLMIFSNKVSERSKEIFQLRQEKGSEYIPLVDLFNALQDLIAHKDVVDNFNEFKIILKYPELTPYMFAFTEVKPNTFKGLLRIAKKEYTFRDETDFVLNYYLPLHDNFGISDTGIGSIIKKAKKRANANKVLNKIDLKLKSTHKRKVPVWGVLLHVALYFPVFLIYFVFEIVKAIFTELHKFVIPSFVTVFLIENFLLSSSDIGSVLVLFKIFNKNDWFTFLSNFFGEMIADSFDAIIFSLLFIVLLFIVYAIPGLLISSLIKYFSTYINKGFDWIGIERTFQNMFRTLMIKTESKFASHKKFFIKDSIKGICTNILCVSFIVFAIVFIPLGLEKLSETTGYFYNEDEAIVTLVNDECAEVIVEKADIYEYSSSNNDVIYYYRLGQVVTLTGNEEVDWDDSILYEIYLDDENFNTGWIEAENIEIRSMGD